VGKARTLAQVYRHFGEVDAAETSPLYERVAVALSESGEALRAIEAAPARKRHPTVILAALQDLALAGRAPALAAAILSELRAADALPPSGKPQTVPSVPDSKEPGMDDATKQALLSELRTQVATEIETKLAEQQAQHTDALKAARDEATKLAEAAVQAKDAELKTVREEIAAIRTREQAAEAKALHVEAVRFAETQLRKPRIFKAQVPTATALYELLPSTPAVKADAAKAMGLSEQDWSLRDLFVAFAESYPTAKFLTDYMAEFNAFVTRVRAVLPRDA